MAIPQDKHVDYRRDLQLLDELVEQLKREYDMYFAGVLKRQPFDLKNRVEALFRRMRAKQVHKLELSFRFNTLQARYSKYCELWDKIFKRREIDPHARSAYGPTREQLAREMADMNRRRRELGQQTSSLESGEPAAAQRRPGAGGAGDPMRELYNQFLDAKKELGESVETLRYENFRRQIESQRENLKKKTGAGDVSFSVVRKGGKVSLTARTKKE